jgi:peroxiredoxin family protein
MSSKRVAIVCTKADLPLAYPALLLANAARQAGLDASLFFMFRGIDVVTTFTLDCLPVDPASDLAGAAPGAPLRARMGAIDLPTVREMLAFLDESGVEIYACELTMRLFGRVRGDLAPQVRDPITLSDFYEAWVGAELLHV